MQRSRGSELPQRQSPRAPLQLRTSSSESDGHHPTNRPIVDRSPKLGDRRSPRGPLTEKKRVTRVADLEIQLGKVQEELKKLKAQLASTEAAKKEALEELEMAKKQIPAEKPEEVKESPAKDDSTQSKSYEGENIMEENSPETDVFEVPVPEMPVELQIEVTQKSGQVENGTKQMDERSEPLAETEKPLDPPENAEVVELKSKLAEKEKEIENLQAENEELKRQVSDATNEASVARAKEQEAALRVSRMGHELEDSKATANKVKEELEAAEGAKFVLETEMKGLRVQTEQWRKAADAAAAVLAGGVEMNGRRAAERCRSMDKHLVGFESDVYGGLGSPMADGYDDGLDGGKRKGGGMRMFGDLWKRKGQK